MPNPPNIPVGRYSEAQFTQARPDCPQPEHWTTNDIQATENEVIEMVGGLIQGLQPDVSLETGTSRGFMARRIDQALRKNGHGHLHSYEKNEEVWQEAMKTVGRSPYTTLHNAPSMQEWTYGPIDFAWHDSVLNARQAEFEFYLTHYSERAIVCFHDTASHFGPWSDKLRQKLSSVGFQYIDWPSPRGVIISRRG